MATPLSELQAWWNGTQFHTATSGTASRGFDAPGPTIGPVEYDVSLAPVILTGVAGGEMEEGEPVPRACIVDLPIVSRITGAASAAACERKMYDEFQDLATIFNPANGEVKLRFDRVNGSGTTISREMFARAISIPRFSSDNIFGRGEHSTSGAIRFPVRALCRMPWFYNRTAETLAFTPTPGSPDTDTIANDGQLAIGCKMVVSSVVGSPTAIRIQNTTTNDELTIKKTSGNIANNDEVDFFYTDPTKVTMSSNVKIEGTSSTTGDAFMALATGNNSITVTQTAGTSLTLTFSWKEAYYTL